MHMIPPLWKAKEVVGTTSTGIETNVHRTIFKITVVCLSELHNFDAPNMHLAEISSGRLTFWSSGVGDSRLENCIRLSHLDLNMDYQ